MQQTALRSAIEALRSAGQGRAGWCDVALQVRQAVGADATTVFVFNSSTHEVLCKEGLGVDPNTMREYEEYYYAYDVLLQRAPPEGHWQVSNERFPDATWSSDIFFGDLLHRHRIRQILALTLKLSDDIFAALSLHRHTRGPVVANDFARGPLQELTREATLAFEMRYSTAQAVRQALLDGLSSDEAQCFLVDAELKVHAPRRIRSHARLNGVSVLRGRLWHPNAATQSRMHAIVRRATSGVHGKLMLPNRGGRALLLRAIPLPPQGRLTAHESLAVVHVEDYDTVPSAAELADLYGLTPTQARVLRLLGDGLNVKACADKLSISEATVRTHIAHLMLRLGCNRQSQLVRAALLLS